MAQPIKRKIQEMHPDKMVEEPFYTLLVDGNSLLFNCMKDDKRNIDNIHYGGVFQFLLQLRILLSKRDFRYVYVFFDDEYSGWLRWNIYNSYKANRDKHYEEYGISDYMKQYNANLKAMQKAIYSKSKKKRESKEKSEWEKFIDDNFDRERDILCMMFNELFIRWNIDDVSEGDDQIAYYCNNKKPNEKIYIVSSDMDLTQLIADDICIYNQQKKKFITNKNFNDYFDYYYENTLVKKVFCGDVSDNIGNIKLLSEEAFYKLMPEIKTRKITIEEVKERAKQLIIERRNENKKPLQVHENIVNGVSNKEYDGDFYEINKKIVDLSHPLLSKEAKETMDAMMYAPQDPTDRSTKNLYKIILDNGIDEFNGDTKFASFFSIFKKIENNERKLYEESLKI